MEDSTFINPKVDLPFKKIFGSENSTDILISILNAIIYDGKSTITDVIILNPYVPGEGIDEKVSIVDIQAVLNNGDLIIVEMQKSDVRAFLERVLYNGSKRLGSQLKPGIYYDQLVPVISIIIVDFEMIEGLDDPVSHFILREEKSGLPFPAYQYLHFFMVELPKSKLTIDDLGENSRLIDKWLVFMNEAERLKEVPPTMAMTPAINHAFEIARRLNIKRDEREILERRERDAMAFEKTIEWREDQALEKGERIGIEKTIKIVRMLEKGEMSYTEIAALVELPVTEIERIDAARQAK